MESNQNNTTNTRNSAFEILRIISIIFVVASHFATWGEFDFTRLETSTVVIINSAILTLYTSLGTVGVIFFVLISSYFLSDGRKFQIRRVLLLLLEMLTFSIILGITFFVVLKKEFILSNLTSIFFPFGTGLWWFMTSYLLTYIFSPIFNLAINKMNKKANSIFVVFLLVIWSLLPTLFGLSYGTSKFAFFVLLYFIGAYIRKYDITLKLKPWLCILISVVVYLLVFAARVSISEFVKDETELILMVKKWIRFADKANFIQLCCCVMTFLAFKQINMKDLKFINIVASTTLTTYLIHNHPDMRNFLWVKVFHVSEYIESPYLFLYSLGVVLTVVIAGTIVGIAYRYTLLKAYKKFVQWLDKKWLHQFDDAINSISYQETN